MSKILRGQVMRLNLKETAIEVKEDDITEQSVDAVVNPANEHLVLGGGVAGAIRKKGGDVIQQECDILSPITVGEAVMTTGGHLKAGHVIHAVGPRMGEGDEDNKLKNAVANALRIADDNGFSSIALPAISTGIFGYPMEKCAKIMMSEIVDFINAGTVLREIVICVFGTEAYDIFVQQLEEAIQK